MNIFLDTSVLFKDPFWKGIYYKELLDTVKKQHINLFTSSIVLKELERNYRKLIEEENERLLKIQDKAEHYELKQINIAIIDAELSIQALNSFYNSLVFQRVIKILDYENSILPEIVERSIWKKRPFSETKTEMKDAIIWLTYAKYAEKENLENCFLLTDNVSDFCDPEKLKIKVFQIHQDLLLDSKKFEIYTSPKNLLQQKKSIFQNVTRRSWLDEQEITNDFLLSLVKKKHQQTINRKLSEKFERYDLNQIFNSEYPLNGYIILTETNFTSIENIETYVFADDALISADLHVYCNLLGYEYSPDNDFGDSYKYYNETNVLAVLTFSLAYDNMGKNTNFEVDRIQIS